MKIIFTIIFAINFYPSLYTFDVWSDTPPCIEFEKDPDFDNTDFLFDDMDSFGRKVYSELLNDDINKFIDATLIPTDEGPDTRIDSKPRNLYKFN